MTRADLLRRDLAADVDVAFEDDALVLEDLHAAVDDPLLQLVVRDAEANEPSDPLVAFIDGDRVAGVVELRGNRHPGGTRADDADGRARAVLRRARYDPALAVGL